MMYDDIAENPSNPTKGVIINHPNGSDVYGGVVIDYKGKDVTPENFLAALSGNEKMLKGIGSGKVIKSGPNDHVFVFFTDHGAPGIVAFPDGELHARDLLATLMSMHSGKKYAQMVLYIEACESGSMFDGLLPQNISVFATTAANAHESSYACYYDDLRGTYLGDWYSVNWMEDSDKKNLNVETLQEQFLVVQKITNTSHVMEYGDLKISKQPVADFQSDGSRENPSPIVLPAVPLDVVPSEQVPLSILYRQLMSAKDQSKQQEIRHKMSQLLQSYSEVDEALKLIVSLSTGSNEKMHHVLGDHRHQLTNFDCYEPVVTLFDQRCFDISQNDYARSQLHVLVNLCEEGIRRGTILEMIAKVCQ
jgi:legumain